MFLRKAPRCVLIKNKSKNILSLRTQIPRSSSHVKKVSLSSALKSMRGETSMSISGSVTVEASFVLSFFILFCASIMSLFFVLQNEVNIACELNERSQKMAVYASVADDYDGDVFLAKTSAEHISYLPEWAGRFMVLEESVRKPWTGRIIEEEDKNEDDTFVYVAENGSVYHTTESCSHLSLTISMVEYENLEDYRNESGGKYRACEKCGGEADVVFIAKEGDCYHSSRNCSGLKRNYKRVKLTEVNLPACKRCGG